MLFSNGVEHSTKEFGRLSNVKYIDSSSRFQLKTRSEYNKQFAHIYAKRLNGMRSLLHEKAKEKWGKYQINSSIIFNN